MSTISVDPKQLWSGSTYTYEDAVEDKSLDELCTLTNTDLDKFIDLYAERSAKFKRYSIKIRWCAVLAGAGALIALNPAVLAGAGALIPSDVAVDPNITYGIVTLLGIISGVAITIDRYFSVTWKYTDSLATALELGLEKARFNAAFSKFKSPAEPPSKESFSEAKTLAEKTFVEFTEKRSKKREEWATNLQSVMDAIRKESDQRLKSLKSASEKVLELQESQDVSRAARSASFGLTILVAKIDGRGPETFCCIVKSVDTDSEAAKLRLRVGQGTSGFFQKGKYTVSLVESGDVIASKAVTLESDKEIKL